MIPTHPEWAACIAEYARFILDDESIRRNWLDRVRPDSSIYSPNELVCQIFVDMNAEEGLEQLASAVGQNAQIYRSIADFISKLSDLSKVLPLGESFHEIENVLKLQQWHSLRRAAANVIDPFN